MENKTNQKTTTKTQTLTDNHSTTSSEVSTQDMAMDKILTSGGDVTLETYRDVVCESIQRQSEQLSALLEKTTLRLNQESVPSGFGNDSPLSDEELDVTVIPSSLRSESASKTIESTQSAAKGGSTPVEGVTSVPTDATNLRIEDGVVERDTDVPTNRDASGSKEVSPSEDKPTSGAGVKGNTSPGGGKTASAVAPPTESSVAPTTSNSGKRRNKRKDAPNGNPVPVEPKEAKSSSRVTMKRGRSTEEPHPEAKKPLTGKLPPPPTAASTPVAAAGREVVARPVQAASVDPRSAKAKPATTNPQPSSQTSRKRKHSQTLYPDNLRVAVIDRAEPEGKISESRWLLIEDRLREQVFLGEDPSRLQFGSATVYKGVKVICCENEESKNFLVTAVAGLQELWDGSALAAVSLKDIPCRRILTAWVPPPSVDPARVLIILGKQNPNLCTDGWRLVGSSTEGGGLVIKVSVDTAGQEYLQARGGKLHFGTGWIRFRLTPPSHGGDATAVRLETRTGKTLFLVSLYLPFEHPDPPGQVVEELASVLGGKGGLIIGCDANAHHSQWGSSNTNARVASASDVDDSVKLLTKILIGSYERACPLTFPGKRHQPVWWSKDLAQLRKTSRRLYNKANKTKLGTDWEAYKLAFNKYNSEIKKAKRRSWVCFTESIDDVNAASRFRRVLSKDPKSIGSIKRTDGSWTDSGLETLNLLASTHFPNCSDAVFDRLATRSSQHSGTEDVNLTNSIVNTPKILWAINSFKPFKSPGPDGIIPAMLQHASAEIIPVLEVIFKACLRLSHIPLLWREVTVTYIPKAGKPSHVLPKDYRPISLSSFLLKTLERLIDIEIRSLIPLTSLSTAQHAYMKGKSVESAQHDVVGYIEKNLNSSCFTLAAFLDIEGAFNNVTLEAIHSSLERLSVPPLLVDWIDVMLSSRIVNSSIGECSVRKTVTRGTPQGGVLSPLLWLLVINNILLDLEHSGTKVVAYADDVVLLIAGRFPQTITDLMQGALVKLSRWARCNGLGVNPPKTEFVLFTRRRKIPVLSLPMLDGVTLSLSSEAKYLGTILDQKLSWKRNIEERAKKGLNALYSCKNSIGNSWGLKPHIIRWIYESVVRPILTYGALVWWHSLRKITFSKNIDKVQRVASLLITGAVRSTPQSALDTLLNLKPLGLFVEELAARCALRLNELGQWRSQPFGHSVILKYVENVSNQAIASDYILPRHSFDLLDIRIPNRDIWSRGTPPFDGIAVYTDGSKMESGTGAGVYCESLSIRRSFRLNSDCSVFQAEIFAVRMAIELLNNRINELDGPVTIYVDSQAALKALNSFTIKSMAVLECKNALEKFKSVVKLCWVPGHCNISGNESADELARRGSESVDLEIESSVKPPLCHFFQVLHKHYLGRFQQNWLSGRGCIISKKIWPVNSERRSRSLLSMTKLDLKLVVGLITGHCNIKAMTSKWGGDDTEYCRLCQDEEETETVEHLLCHCPTLIGVRHRLLGKHLLPDLSCLFETEPAVILQLARRLKWLRTTR
ncbi:uncharacterized protein LOC109613882 [Musca domestica]|uniref:Uncharacterized protein LOC109613882 n=1 Tax=Musca domestica TaxID=7370 RepID=A0ABM3UYM1_MUSDO|nr:uncharacterized protein LOC109613882 [Musca domestica]